MTRQIPLDLPTKESFSRSDFVITPANELALDMIENSDRWPAGRMLLIGPRGAGKSHLAQIWATATGARIQPAEAIAGADLESLARGGAVAVENAETVAGHPGAEAAMFHLCNMLGQGGRLLITAILPPRDWGLQLPDLLSRLQSGGLMRLSPPDDALLQKVLIKLFSDRQIIPSAGLIPYILARMPRSIGAARAIITEMDRRAMAEQRPLGPKLAAEVLNSLAQE